MTTSFKEEVVEVVRRIPVGETMSYKEVAEAVGRPGAARAVGNILSTNIDPEVPCHRVIRSDGTPGGYNGIRGEKEKLLDEEKTTRS